MSINFHDASNRMTYTTRSADESWLACIQEHVVVTGKVRSALEINGFHVTAEVKLWETRQVYNDFESLAQDLLNRTGRSILHSLTDSELQELVDYVQVKLQGHIPITEKDRWTLWVWKK